MKGCLDVVVQLHTFPVVVVGSGISGLYTAIKLAETGTRVLLVTKASLAETNSRYAQGGIAAVLPDNLEDSVELHIQDTLRAGAGLCHETAVRSILSDGHAAIQDLLRLGVPFDRTRDSRLALGHEAAHSVRRIVHAGGDATGQSVELTLIERVKASPNIEVMEDVQAVELLWAGHRVYGCRLVDLRSGQQHLVLAPHTVLATGGIGRLYQHTTNPAIATGDGLALAWRVLKHFPSTLPALHDMEFVQFHPTAFYHDGRVHFLISEAVRGEGAYLVNANGQRFMPTVHPDAELAPRDVVTRAIFAEMSHAQAPCVYLDVRHFPAGLMQKRFPSIYQWLRRLHLETARDLIPVTPAAHYLMGGIPVNLRGESTAKGLYAVGEVAATGLHGANRLASNSLLECVVLARRVAETIAIRQATAEAAGVSWTLPEPLNLTPVPYQMLPPGHALLRTLEENTKALAQLMWEQVGIIRQTSRLRDALKTLHRWEAQAQEGQWRWIVPQGLEYVDRLLLARLTAQAAWNRKQSVGAHYRLSDKIAEREPRPVSGGGVSSSVATPGGSPRPGARLALVTTAAASGSPNPHGSPL